MDVSTLALNKVHPKWLALFPEEFSKAAEILNRISDYQPQPLDVFKVFTIDPGEVRVVIVGQDPYPTAGDATGIAFSVDRDAKLPKSLQNIFKELEKNYSWCIFKCN